MIATPIVKESALNTSVTEAQLKLAISQVLSLPSAYNAPVIVLDFKIGDNGLVTGRFRDAARPRVFSYEIDDDGIAFKPFVPGRMDSLNENIWEDFSDGFTYRVDAATSKSKSRRQCVKPTAYNCGKSCININKTCKVNPKDATSSMRRKRLKAVAEEFKKAQKITSGGGGSISELKPELVKPLVENKLTSNPPVEPDRETATDKEWADYEKAYDDYYGKDEEFKTPAGKSVEEQKAERQREYEQEKQNLFKLLPVGVKRGIADRKDTEIRKRLGLYVDGGQSEKQSQNAGDRNNFEKSKLTKDQKKAINLYDREVEITIAHDYLSNRWGSTAQGQRQQGNAPKEGTEQRIGNTIYKVKGGEWTATGDKDLGERKQKDHFNDLGEWVVVKQ